MTVRVEVQVIDDPRVGRAVLAQFDGWHVVLSADAAADLGARLLSAGQLARLTPGSATPEDQS